MSYRYDIGPRKQKAGRLLAQIRRELQKAFLEEKASRKLTQAELARALEVHRSVVNRQLSGTENLTIRSLADYAWALERDVIFAFAKPATTPGSNQSARIAEAPTTETTASTAQLEEVGPVVKVGT